MTPLVSWGSIAFAVLALLRLYSRGGARNVLFAIAAFFVYFAYGPVLNLLQGREVYAGIIRSQVDVAVTGFALALAGMLIGDQLVPQRTRFTATRVTSGPRQYQGLILVLAVLAAYGLLFVVTHPTLLLTSNKLSAISAAGAFHYPYLTVQACAVSTFFICRRSNLLRGLWMVNTVAFTAYCLLTSERDFLFLFFMILVLREMLGNHTRTLRLAAGAAVAVFVGSLLFANRGNDRLDVADTLNQGSLLFVDTFVSGNVPRVYPFEWGDTYLEALAGLSPWALLGPSPDSLADWLVSVYAPRSDSGYGFSMTAEAYLNFGLIGVPVVFVLLTIGHRFVVNRADRSDWWGYLSVYSSTAWLYALRGSSVEFFRALLYGAIFFAGIWVVSTVRRPTTAERPDERDSVASRPEVPDGPQRAARRSGSGR